MSIKPILFNTDMVRAILDGRKTVTRRLIKPQPSKGKDCVGWCIDSTSGKEIGCAGFGRYGNIEFFRPPYQIGDIIYVRETWFNSGSRYMYRANYSESEKFYCNGKEIAMKWYPSIHMPKEAARIWLIVTDVSVERLQCITEEQAIKEGFDHGSCQHEGAVWGQEDGDEWTAKTAFIALWDSTISKKNLDTYSWYANPWVWVIEFERCEKPEEGA